MPIKIEKVDKIYERTEVVKKGETDFKRIRDLQELKIKITKLNLLIWWLTPVNCRTWEVKQEDQKFKVCLDYMMNLMQS